MDNLIKIKILINKFWENAWSIIKDHTFKVSVDNQIKIPEVKIPEVNIPEPIDTREELTNIVNAIIKQTQDLKISPDTSATKKELLDTLKEISERLNVDEEEETDDEQELATVNEIKALRDDLSAIAGKLPKTDLKPVQSQIEALTKTLDFSGLKKFTRFTDIRVFINEKQFEKLAKSMGSVIATSGGSGQIKNASGVISDDNPLAVKVDSEGGTATATEGSGAITVGSSSTSVVSANADRKRIIMVNDSDEPIYLAYGEAAVMNQGIRLNASGGAMIDDIWLGTIFAICSSGSKELTYIEI
jgi:hypothetical protein